MSREVLYNGIRLPAVWPPRDIDPASGKPLAVPYLNHPPAVIPIDVGRQLLVDDFLIEETSLRRTFHTPKYFDSNPIFKPETALEMDGGLCPVAVPFNDGVLYDEQDKLFKMWYQAGWNGAVAYAISADGIHWERPNLDVEPGTNRVLPEREGFKRDGAGVWLDHTAERESERYKMFVYFRAPGWEGGEVYTSPDGIHWSEPVRTGPCGDNTTFFYNPFRNKWVYSIRSVQVTGVVKESTLAASDPEFPAALSALHLERNRVYVEHDHFIDGARWGRADMAFWCRADELDPPHPQVGDPAQLYNIDAVAYESLMLGIFQIHGGPDNDICARGGFPKYTELQLAFSRDGFHFDRTNRAPFLAPTQQVGDWNRAYLHSAGGCCLVVGNELFFYYSGFSGVSPKLGRHMYAGGSTGLAKIRRDGFASMDAGEAEGRLTTRPVFFSGKYLFVNASTLGGRLQIEILDEHNQVMPPFSKENCIAVSADSTKQIVRWKNTSDLRALKNKPVKFKFHLTNGRLYAFWVSPHQSGASNGYLAAGSPGVMGLIDTVGI